MVNQDPPTWLKTNRENENSSSIRHQKQDILIEKNPIRKKKRGKKHHTQKIPKATIPSKVGVQKMYEEVTKRRILTDLRSSKRERKQNGTNQPET